MSVQPQQPEQLALSLPYEEITKVANRDYLRKNFTRAPRDSYYIEFEKILERDNFNQRKVYEGIEELAQSILASGLKTPFVLDVLPDNRVFTEEGHRRKRAIQLLIDRKEEGWTGKTLVEFFPNKSDATELNRMVNQYTSNNHKKKLKPYEAAEVAFNVKNNYRRVRSNDEVATLMGVSRQQVDNYILIATSSDDLKNQMVMADMNLTDCLALLKSKKKLEKQTDQVEEDSHKNTAPPTPFPKDPLADEVKELAELEKETDEERDLRLLREKTKSDQEHEQLMEVSDEIKVKKLKEHIGRKLSAPAVRTWTEDFVDEDTSEVVTIDRNEILVPKGEVITEEIVEKLKDWKGLGIDTIFVYKKGCEPVAASVITEPVAQKEKSKYDESRPEVAQVQNIIKIADKIEAVVNKLDCPDQTKLDLGNYVKWLQKDAAELRDWVHTNKKQNKIR